MWKGSHLYADSEKEKSTKTPFCCCVYYIKSFEGKYREKLFNRKSGYSQRCKKPKERLAPSGSAAVSEVMRAPQCEENEKVNCFLFHLKK